MPAWKSAKQSGQNAAQRSYKERTIQDLNVYAGPYDFDDKKCFFCRSRKGRMRTGYLAVTGCIWWCAKCGEDTLRDEQVFERTL